MNTRVEQLLLGEATESDLRDGLLLLFALLVWAQYDGTQWLLFPLLLAGLLETKKILFPLALALSVPWFGHGTFPLLAGLVIYFLIEGFRGRVGQESRLAEMRGEVLQTLGHELRNPLFAAKGTIDALMARNKNITADELQQQLTMASGAMQAINQEVDDLTQLLRLESGSLRARPASIRIGSVFDNLRGRFPLSRHPDRPIEFKGEGLTLTADPLLLTQALDKLISNALVHSSEGAITVRAFRDDRGAVLEVEDEGPGIPLSEREKIFERFRQLSPNSIGFGLGLYLARQYVGAQGGTLRLEDTKTGCLFKIRLEEGAKDD